MATYLLFVYSFLPIYDLLLYFCLLIYSPVSVGGQQETESKATSTESEEPYFGSRSPSRSTSDSRPVSQSESSSSASSGTRDSVLSSDSSDHTQKGGPQQQEVITESYQDLESLLHRVIYKKDQAEKRISWEKVPQLASAKGAFTWGELLTKELEEEAGSKLFFVIKLF